MLLVAGKSDQLGRESSSYLVLDGVGPEDPAQEVVVVHAHGRPSVLGVDQRAQVVPVEVSYEQVSAVGEDQRGDSGYRGTTSGRHTCYKSVTQRRASHSLHHLSVFSVHLHLGH